MPPDPNDGDKGTPVPVPLPELDPALCKILGFFFFLTATILLLSDAVGASASAVFCIALIFVLFGSIFTLGSLSWLGGANANSQISTRAPNGWRRVELFTLPSIEVYARMACETNEGESQTDWDDQQGHQGGDGERDVFYGPEPEPEPSYGPFYGPEPDPDPPGPSDACYLPSPTRRHVQNPFQHSFQPRTVPSVSSGQFWNNSPSWTRQHEMLEKKKRERGVMADYKFQDHTHRQNGWMNDSPLFLSGRVMVAPASVDSWANRAVYDGGSSGGSSINDIPGREQDVDVWMSGGCFSEQKPQNSWGSGGGNAWQRRDYY